MEPPVTVSRNQGAKITGRDAKTSIGLRDGGWADRAAKPEARNSLPEGGGQPFPEPLIWCRKTRHQPHQPPTSSEMPAGMVAEVPLTGLSFR